MRVIILHNHDVLGQPCSICSGSVDVKNMPIFNGWRRGDGVVGESPGKPIRSCFDAVCKQGLLLFSFQSQLITLLLGFCNPLVFFPSDFSTIVIFVDRRALAPGPYTGGLRVRDHRSDRGLQPKRQAHSRSDCGSFGNLVFFYFRSVWLNYSSKNSVIAICDFFAYTSEVQTPSQVCVREGGVHVCVGAHVSVCMLF